MNSINLKISEALTALRLLGMPKHQLNHRTAITLLALLDLTPEIDWSEAKNPMLTIRGILDFSREHYETNYAENTRESVRKYSVKQLVSSGILLHNPDDPTRAVNSSKNCYMVESKALELFKTFGSKHWDKQLKSYLAIQGSLVKKYAMERKINKVPLQIKEGNIISLSAGAHSNLIKEIIEVFAQYFVPGGELIYVGDTGSKWGFYNEELLKSLHVNVDEHGKMPDVIIYHREKNWLILAEAVTSSGPIDNIRYIELIELFLDSTADLVFVTAFPDRGELFRKFLDVVSWETEVWCASDPTHLIHFNGIKFLGPYKL